MTHNEIIKLLLDAGFDSGWSLSGTELLLWEHDENPPPPLTRPVTNETSIS